MTISLITRIYKIMHISAHAWLSMFRLFFFTFIYLMFYYLTKNSTHLGLLSINHPILYNSLFVIVVMSHAQIYAEMQKQATEVTLIGIQYKVGYLSSNPR